MITEYVLIWRRFLDATWESLLNSSKQKMMKIFKLLLYLLWILFVFYLVWSSVHNPGQQV